MLEGAQKDHGTYDSVDSYFRRNRSLQAGHVKHMPHCDHGNGTDAGRST